MGEPRQARALALTYWLLGAGFLLTVCMAYVAGANFAMVKPDRLPQEERAFGLIPEDVRQESMRYIASEINRHLFPLYNHAHAVLFGGAFVAYLFHRSRRMWILVCLLFFAGVTGANYSYFTPRLIDLGREIDFDRKGAVWQAKKDEFDRIHQINVIVESSKLLAILVVSSALILGRLRTR